MSKIESESPLAKQPRFQLTSTPRGDLVFHDGFKRIEVGIDSNESRRPVIITLFKKSIRQWYHPHHDEPVTDDVREEILTEVTRLLKDQAAVEGSPIKVEVKR